MKTKNWFLIVIFVSCTLSLARTSWAEVEDENDYPSQDNELQSYDEIVKDLSRPPVQAKSRVKLPATHSSDSSFENTTIHAGVAYANMFETLDAPNGKIFVGQPGVQVSLGIDLFSEHLSSEGTLITFGDQSYEGNTVSVKEFDLMFYGKGEILPKVKAKVGAGIAGRYLTLTRNNLPTQYSTPSSVLSVGADYYLAEAISLGGEVSMKNAMVGETIDQNSYTMLLRLDTHF